MAIVVVTANNTRIEDSESSLGWSGRGGGAGPSAEAPLAYQGNNTVNRKVASATGAGFEYDPVADGGVAHNMTTTDKSHWMVKFIVTDAGGLRANDGVRIIIGDGGNEYAVVVAGTDSVKAAYSTYLLRSSTIIVPVNPNIAGYRDVTHSGAGVTLTAVDQFGIDGEFAIGTAKSENIGLDAIDLGTGLTLIGGDGVSPDGTWADFVSTDEGIINNRWGYASSFYGTINLFFGTLTVGAATATEFVDNFSTNLWPDGFYAEGFSGPRMDLQNASTIITDGAKHTSLGTDPVQNTRADYTWVGTSGTGIGRHVLENFRNYTMTSAVTVDDAEIECQNLTQAFGTIQNSTIKCNAGSGVAVLDDATFSNLSNNTWEQTGTGHAIEITTIGTHTFDAQVFVGFGGAAGSNATPNSGATDAAIYNNSGGAVTIAIVNGGGTPSVRNGAGATTVAENAVPISLTGLIAGSRVYIENTTDAIVLFNQVEATTSFGSSIGYSSDKNLLIRVRNASNGTKYKPYTAAGLLTSTGFSLIVNQELDE